VLEMILKLSRVVYSVIGLNTCKGQTPSESVRRDASFAGVRVKNLYHQTK